MRMIILAATLATIGLAGPGVAQSPSQPSPGAQPPAAAPQAPAGAPSIKSVNVIDIEELPEATRTQVNELLSRRSAGEAQQLQTAIEGVPAAKAAVEAKGFTARDVVIAQVNDEGELTIVTKRAG